MPAGLRRYYGKGHLHFITFSCYRRLPLLKTARARDLFVRELARVREELSFRLIGHVVMPEHVHLLMSEPQRGTPSTVLQKLKLRVARKMRKRRRKAPAGQMGLPFKECAEPLRAFWQARFYDFNVYSERKRMEKLKLYARESDPSKAGEGCERLAVEQLGVLCTGGESPDTDRCVRRIGRHRRPRHPKTREKSEDPGFKNRNLDWIRAKAPFA